MAKSWNRMETWLTVIVLGVGGLILGLAGVWVYVSATATPLHPNAQDVPSETRVAAAPRWSGAVEKSRQLVRTALSEQNLPGVSVAIGAGGELAWAEGFGWANIEKKTAVGPQTRFRIGTASTVLTSAAAGLLLEKDRLKLDENIQTYVSEFSAKQWPVTLKQVMAHTAGLRNDGGDESSLFEQHCARPAAALPHFAERELLFEPGTQYRYSRYGWILVSAAVEEVADEPFLSFMKTQVFEPLGMRDTMPDADAIPDLATSYFPRFAADPRYGPDLMREIDLSCYAGGSIFVSTPSDLVRFGMAINGGKLLQPATVELLQAPQRLASGAETGYGLGWDLETVSLSGRQTRAAGHDGDLLGGPMASLLVLREHDLVVAVIANTSYADTESIAIKIAEAFVEQGRATAPNPQ